MVPEGGRFAWQATYAYGDDEKLSAFRQAFEDNVTLPLDRFVIGEPVSVIEIEYDNQGARFLLGDIRAGKAWDENREER